VLLGVVLKQRISLATVTRAVSVPLFFLSGIFGPITYLTWPVQLLARLFPTHYAIVLEQFAFKGFVTNTLGVAGNVGLLCIFLMLFLSLAILALERNTITH
jgi:ABC-2 type transport system permease protein